MKIAIITGASSGLGKEFIRALSKRKTELDEIWVIARRSNRLDELKTEFPELDIVPVPLDLCDDDSFDKLAQKLEETAPDVRLLINNAGTGKLGYIADDSWREQKRMTELNVGALTAVTTVVLPYMNSGASIINICSIASFSPTPRMTVYGATKSFVMSFSRGLRDELRGSNINVMAVCPGPMETEFLGIAGIEKGASKAFDTLPRCNPAKVASHALAFAKKHCAVYTPKLIYKIYRIIAKVLPQELTVKFTRT